MLPKWNGEFHGGRPRPTGAVVPMKKKCYNCYYYYWQVHKLESNWIIIIIVIIIIIIIIIIITTTTTSFVCFHLCSNVFSSSACR
jgi:uncharacterized integral membrane protein